MSIPININNYIFTDGQVLNYESDLKLKTIKIKLQIRKKSKQNKFETCIVELLCEDVLEVYILENFDTNGNYSDFVLTEIENNIIYMPFDPFSNLNEVHENDNWIIKARILNLIELC